MMFNKIKEVCKNYNAFMNKPRTAFGVTIDMMVSMMILFLAIVTQDTKAWTLTAFGFVVFQYFYEKSKNNHYLYGE